MDLNVDNYSLDDLLALFKLGPHFTPEEFKAAKQIVYKTHPDKSGLDKEYFVFFSKAYKLLDCVNKTKHSVTQQYEPEHDSLKADLARRFTEADDFLPKFNTLFEQNYVKSADEARGYGDWMRSQRDMDTSYETLKRDSRAIIAKPDEYVPHSSLRAASLDGDNYVDLKRSYTVDSIIGVSEADLQERPTLEALKQERAAPIQPMSKEDAQREFLARAESESLADTRRAFKLAKQNNRQLLNLLSY